MRNHAKYRSGSRKLDIFQAFHVPEFSQDGLIDLGFQFGQVLLGKIKPREIYQEISAGRGHGGHGYLLPSPLLTMLTLDSFRAKKPECNRFQSVPMAGRMSFHGKETVAVAMRGGAVEKTLRVASVWLGAFR